MATKNTTNTKPTNTNSSYHHEFEVYCNLLHGWFKQAERFETFAATCADHAKLAVKVAKSKGIL